MKTLDQSTHNQGLRLKVESVHCGVFADLRVTRPHSSLPDKRQTREVRHPCSNKCVKMCVCVCVRVCMYVCCVYVRIFYLSKDVRLQASHRRQEELDEYVTRRPRTQEVYSTYVDKL